MKVQAVSELLRLVPPCEGYAENIDWGPVEADLGRSLPSDYKEFLRCLFAGEFEDWPIRLAKNFLLPAPAFVHRRLWDERQEAGLDPVTGLEEPGRYTF
ncbi:hypothetical protein AB0O31_18430 [Kitasatospora cineracea]|uniref:hypothetical protein n=1 Tax=Kitasatospora cineracea TaxID=88074 RepID=UPI003440FDE3